MPTPVPTQVSIILRVLAFDRAFQASTADEIVVGVLYQENPRESARAMRDLVAALAEIGKGPTGERLRAVPLRYEGPAELRDSIRNARIDVLYVAPLRAVDLEEVLGACRSSGVLATTGVPDYVRWGVGVGVGSRGGRPNIIINLEASQAMGADFSSELLKLAEIVGDLREPPAPRPGGPLRRPPVLFRAVARATDPPHSPLP